MQLPSHPLFTLSATKVADKYFRTFLLIAFAALGFLLAVGQDVIHATFHNYSFYLSESLLFGSYWLCFFPLLYGLLLSSKQCPVSIFNQFSFGNVAILTLTLSLLHLLLFALLVFGGSTLLLDHTFGYLGILKSTLADDLYKNILIYGMATGSILSKKPEKRSEIKLHTVRNTPPTMIAIGTEKKYISLPVEDILMIRTAKPYIELHTAHGKYLHASSLKGMLEKLDKAQFVRVHKSTVVNLNKVTSYTSRLNGDYDITLATGEIVRMSRNYRDSFKDKFL